ncbi:EI24 domain-containing protein [bacterium]|nr:EI24 domain-containing protein [bacterium]
MFKSIIKGIGDYKGSLKLINDLNLWKFFLIPIGICVLVALAIYFAAYGLSDNVADYLMQSWTWKWGRNTMHAIFEVMAFLIILLAGYLVFKRVVMALSAPFMSPISEKIEEHITGKKINSGASFMELLLRGIKVNLRNLSLELMWTFLLFVLGFIPIIGLLTAPVIFLIQAYFIGFGNMDYTLERHMNYKKGVAFVQKNKGVAIGNGVIFALLLLIPVIGFIIAIPFSVTAATVSTIDAIKEAEP